MCPVYEREKIHLQGGHVQTMYFPGHKKTQQTSNPFTTRIPSIKHTHASRKVKINQRVLLVSTTKDERYLD